MNFKLIKCIIVLLVSGVAVFFSSCHGNTTSGEFEVPQSFDDTKNYEITFWAKNDTNKNQIKIYEDAISDFSEYYPNISVKMRLYNDYGKIYNDVITNIATSTTPNVCITYPDHIATYISGSNTVVPLDMLMRDDAYGMGGEKIKFVAPAVSDIIPNFLDECKIGGTTYALPFMRSTEVCYVNKDFVNALGFELPEKLTWDFVWQVSDAASKKESDGTFSLNGQKVMIPFIYKSTDNMMIQMLKQLDAGYSDSDGNIFIFNKKTEKILSDVALHTKKGAFSTFKISGYPGNFLNAGQCIFAVDSTAGATWMGTNAPMQDISKENIAEFETVVMEIPQFDPDNPKMISQGPSVCIFNKEDPAEVMASWLFVQFLLTNEVQIAYSQTEGYIPVTSMAQNSDVYKDYIAASGADNDVHYDVKINAAKILLENTHNTFVTPVFAGSSSLRDAAGQLVENVTKSTRRKETVDQKYFQKLYDDVSSLYRLDELGNSHENEIKNFGRLPLMSVILLWSLGITWFFIIVYALKSIVFGRKIAKK